MHDIRSGPGPNRFLCAVTEEIENPFSVTVMLRPLDAADGVPLGWEMGKAEWADLRRETVEIHLPPESLLLLK